MNIIQQISHHLFHNHKEVKLDYNHIIDGIYAGTNQCCIGALNKVFVDEKISADISLEAERIDQPYGVETYTWIPFVDHQPPTIDQLNFGIATLETLVSQNKKIYIHCKNGHGRTSTLLCGYLMKKWGVDREKAFEFIKEHRPGAHMQSSQKRFLDENTHNIK